MRRSVIFSLLISVLLLFGGTPNVAVAESDDVIVPFAADQPITEDDLLDDSDAPRASRSAEGEEKITIGRSSGNSASPQKAKKGTLIVVNQTRDNPLVYLDDRAYGNCMPPGSTLKIRKVPQGTHKFYAEDCGGQGHWGPTNIQVQKKTTLNLTD